MNKLQKKRSFLLFFTVYACWFAGCSKCGNEMKEAGMSPSRNVLEVHNLTVASGEGWTSEIWLSGSSFSPSFAVGMGVRITPPQKVEHKAVSGALRAELRSVPDNTVIREATFTLRTSLVNRQSSDVISIDAHGDMKRGGIFSPNSWEMQIRDVFGTDFTKAERQPLDEGNFALDVYIEIVEGPSVSVRNVPLTVRRRD